MALFIPGGGGAAVVAEQGVHHKKSSANVYSFCRTLDWHRLIGRGRFFADVVVVCWVAQLS